MNFSTNSPASAKLLAAEAPHAVEGLAKRIRRRAGLHADTAAAGGALEHHGKADRLRLGERVVDIGEQAAAGHERHVAGRREPPRAVLEAKGSSICSGVGPRNAIPAASQAAHEAGILRQEAVARVHRARRRRGAPRRATCPDRGRCRPPRPGPRSNAASQARRCSASRSDSANTPTGLDAKPLQRAGDAHGDRAPVGDQHSLEHAPRVPLSGAQSQTRMSSGVGL